MIALIDADTIYYRAAYKLNKKEVRRAIDMKMREIEGHLLMPHMMVAVKGKGNFRKDLYPDYKRQRVVKEEIKPYLAYGHEHLVNKYDAVMADGMEADDLVSMWARECRDNGDEYTVVGIDKDLLQIPGRHLNFSRMEDQYVSDDSAHYNLMLQCLTGDTSDNIPGIKGIGPVKAAKILSGIHKSRRWLRVRASWKFTSSGSPDLSYRLLKMLETHEEYEDVMSQIQSKTPKREQNVQPKREDDIQESGISGLSE